MHPSGGERDIVRSRTYTRDRLGDLVRPPPVPPVVPCVSALRERDGAVIPMLSEDVLFLAPPALRLDRFKNNSGGTSILQRPQLGHLGLSVVPLHKLSNVGVEVAKFHGH